MGKAVPRPAGPGPGPGHPVRAHSEPGNFIAIESYGVPIIVTRARDGEVRAFLNASIHKGSKLVEHCEPHSAARLT